MSHEGCIFNKLRSWLWFAPTPYEGAPRTQKVKAEPRNRGGHSQQGEELQKPGADFVPGVVVHDVELGHGARVVAAAQNEWSCGSPPKAILQHLEANHPIEAQDGESKPFDF